MRAAGWLMQQSPNDGIAWNERKAETLSCNHYFGPPPLQSSLPHTHPHCRCWPALPAA